MRDSMGMIVGVVMYGSVATAVNTAQDNVLSRWE